MPVNEIKADSVLKYDYPKKKKKEVIPIQIFRTQPWESILNPDKLHFLLWLIACAIVSLTHQYTNESNVFLCLSQASSLNSYLYFML